MIDIFNIKCKLFFSLAFFFFFKIPNSSFLVKQYHPVQEKNWLKKKKHLEPGSYNLFIYLLVQLSLAMPDSAAVGHYILSLLAWS